jgi:serine/threonine-protein kinase
MSDVTERLSSALSDRYTIERELGQGGMATVYLAADTKHDRQVAVKVLRPELAAVLGAERFVQEIKTTANLQHPHILPLFDSGEANSFLYYVMPYVEGESLREKLNREKQLSIEEAIHIAEQVTSALDYAHRHDVIHRDIKPENILIHDGQALVADFGIALAVRAAGGERLTETGLSLGTPQYMSPEQATADRELDARSDVYSLGCVVYEMLTGDPPYTGSTAQAVLARILTDRPRPLAEIRETVPANVAAAVDRALAKLPADRFESAAAFAAALDDPGFTYAPAATAAGAEAGGVRMGKAAVALPTAAARPRERVGTFVPWGVAALAGALALWGWFGPAPSPPPAAATTRVDLALDVPTAGFQRRVAISPDGRWIAYAGGASAVSTQLFVRRADQPEVRPLPGTEGAHGPDFSPDGAWIVFDSFEGLKKIPVEGGPVLVLHPATRTSRDPSWGRDGFVYFAGAPGGTGVYRVPETGGEAETLLETGEALRHPVPLPDGSGVLFTAFRSLGDADVRLLDLGTGEARTLVSPGVHARYLPTGHLVYGHESGALMAVPFGLGRHEVTGSPAPVLPEVAVSVVSGVTQFAVSDGGTAVYLTDASLGRLRLALVGVAGEVDLLPVTAAPGQPAPRFSPDGRRIAFADQGQIHMFDFELGTNAPLTFEGRSAYPVWSRDGRSLVFRRTGTGMMSVAADGSAPPEPLTTPAIEGNPEAWLRDGTQLLYRNPADLYVLTLGDSISSAPYLQGEWNEYAAAVSPDGRFAAYASDESGAFEVYVRSFPTPGARYQVSVRRTEAGSTTGRGTRSSPPASRSSPTSGCSAARRSSPTSPTSPAGSSRPATTSTPTATASCSSEPPETRRPAATPCSPSSPTGSKS